MPKLYQPSPDPEVNKINKVEGDRKWGGKAPKVITRALLSLEAPGFLSDPMQKIVPQRFRTGKLFEEKVKESLWGWFPESFISGPWFQYWERNPYRIQWCQPDGLLIFPREGIIVILEIKSTHTSDAWWQLRKLYSPVVKKVFGEGKEGKGMWEYAVIEIVDRFILGPFPEKVNICHSILDADRDKFNVYLWKDIREEDREVG